ncbi:MAG: sensor histidine kinase KdpD [Verrucomicrobia subdivision 3 bacterium]|nr:sensor histidine kinase KdpD [Limisphaerales bacterium]
MADENRPNPDALLSSIQREEAAQKRGRLKVFLGMSPGVGKTYAMLDAARRELAAGRDVVIGYVETHGRKETDALTVGLPQIPRRALEHRGIALTEFDLDATLARKPQLALVDELAHTNAPGSRHPKRWQDVAELLDAGIDVLTTLNVQHVESRADTVLQVTGSEIRETVPDSILDDAVIELIDLPPAELVQRLHEGKVYLPERATAAAQNFFREANLTALRELALRLVADHVGVDTRDLRRQQTDAGPWKTGHCLLVAVGPGPFSEPLIRWTRRMADGLRCRWLAVHVENPRPLTEAAQAQLGKNLAAARELGAEVIATTDDNVVRGLLRAAREHNVTQIVFGKPGSSPRLEAWLGRSMLQRLIEASGDVDVLVVRADKPESEAAARPPLFRFESQGKQYLTALAVVAIVTLLGLAVQRWIGYQAVALIYLSAVVLLAMVVGRGPNLVAATLTALGWNFLFVPPVLTFHISGFHDTMMFTMYFIVALATGQLTTRLRLQQLAERQREQRASALYQLTRELASASDFPQLLSGAVREVGAVFDADVALLLPDPEANQPLTPYPAGLWVLDEKEEGVAAWAFQHDQPAGRFTDTLPQATALHLPLSAGGKPSGVLALRFHTSRPLSFQQRSLLDSFVRQIALVIDRQRLRDAETTAKLLAQSEQLGRTLLNSVSHELRTPIAAITSAASGLRESGTLTPAQADLAAEIESASARLNRLVQSLLSAARIQSGQVKPHLDWCDVADLVQVAMRSVENLLGQHPVATRIAPGLPLLKLDFVLMEQALANLLVNAAIHTPPVTPVEIVARVEGRELVLEVADRGPGLPVNELERIFDLFHRTADAKPGGTGLGLAIVKGFVVAQGGRVQAANRAGGGANFAIRLPVPDAPSLPEETP